VLLRYLKPEMEIIRVGLVESWRRGLRVVMRQISDAANELRAKRWEALAFLWPHVKIKANPAPRKDSLSFSVIIRRQTPIPLEVSGRLTSFEAGAFP